MGSKFSKVFPVTEIQHTNHPYWQEGSQTTQNYIKYCYLAVLLLKTQTEGTVVAVEQNQHQQILL